MMADACLPVLKKATSLEVAFFCFGRGGKPYPVRDHSPGVVSFSWTGIVFFISPRLKSEQVSYIAVEFVTVTLSNWKI